MNNFCICTLTHNAPDRAEALETTIRSFSKSYNGPKLKWFILVNVTNKDIDKVLKEAVDLYSNQFDFDIQINTSNTGPGAGINKLNRMSEGYEYSLFLEGDWICVPNLITGFSDNWLQNSVKLLEENPEIDQLQLRRYLDDLDDRQYGYGYWVKPENVKEEINNGDRFVILNKREYVNTPTIRRMSTYFKKGVFPLKEHYDSNGKSLEIKGNEEWGMAEINACETAKLNGAWLKFGNFVHFEHFPVREDWDLWINKNTGCNKFKMPGKNSCKYGYMFTTESFCAVCEKDTDYTDLERHSQLWIQDVLGLFDTKMSDEEIFTKMENMTKNPTINLRTDINKDTYKELDYQRQLDKN